MYLTGKHCNKCGCKIFTRFEQSFCGCATKFTLPPNVCWFHGAYDNPESLEMNCPTCEKERKNG